MDNPQPWTLVCKTTALLMLKYSTYTVSLLLRKYLLYVDWSANKLTLMQIAGITKVSEHGPEKRGAVR